MDTVSAKKITISVTRFSSHLTAVQRLQLGLTVVAAHARVASTANHIHDWLEPVLLPWTQVCQIVVSLAVQPGCHRRVLTAHLHSATTA